MVSHLMMDERYYKELAKLSALTEDEIVQELSKYHQGDERALNSIIEANLRLAVHFAKKYETVIQSSDALEMGDLISAANIGLIEAANRYDTTRGTKFSYFASIWIKKELIQLLRQHYNTIKIPENFEGEPDTSTVRMYDNVEYYIDEQEDDTQSELINKLKSSLRYLTPKERKVIKEFFGIDCTPRTLIDIGSDKGQSKQSIWQIKERALNKIKAVI